MESFIVSIPQAVSTVATFERLSLMRKKFQVSIPQAVSTVATLKWVKVNSLVSMVSIPQAVSTVATLSMGYFLNSSYIVFQYRKR